MDHTFSILYSGEGNTYHNEESIMFFDERFDRDQKIQKDESVHRVTDDPMHIDIIPVGETAMLDTRSIAATHIPEQGVSNHPHINELIKNSDDLELVPLHEEGHQQQRGEESPKGEIPQEKRPNHSLGNRIDQIRRQRDMDLIMKHDYVPFRGRKN